MRAYDFVAIGGGNAGLTAAGRIAEAGHRVALVDRGPVGGLCSLNGCNPKKVLVRATEVWEEARHAAALGLEAPPPRIDWEKVIARKESFTAPVTPATEESLRKQGVELLRGSARFVSPGALAVDGETIEARSFLVATGSTPRPLEFEGAAHVRTSDDLLALRRIPARLVILGAGVVGMEFAQVFARAGSQVTVLAPGGRALRGFDGKLVEAMLSHAAGIGVGLRFRSPVRAVRRKGERLLVEFEQEGKAGGIEADFVLNAAGRVAAIGGLTLDQAQVETDARGVVVNEYLRSATNPAVFAAGDARGQLQLSPVASYEGRIVARNFLEGDREPVRHDVVPRALYTVPPLASVGLSEEDAKARGLDAVTIESDMTRWKTYAIYGAPVALARVVLERGTGRILGAHLFAPEAAETIHVYALAMRGGLTAADLKQMVFGYPTLASAVPHTLG